VEELVRGVHLSRSGEYLEQVQAPFITLQLVASGDGTEVIRQSIPSGKRFGLRPEAGWSALECLLVLEGSAVWENGHRSVHLGPGDSLKGAPVQEPCILRATSDLVALYICSQPVFHQVSDELQRLRDLAREVEMKDGATSDHCLRIQRLAARLGTAMNLEPTRQHNLLYGSYLHDLGKVRVPEAILNKPGQLTAAEWDTMKLHTVYGCEMLEHTVVADCRHIPLQHHERWDGKGYPQGLSGQAISLEAQIVTVVDAYDAMTCDRVYRPGMPREQALAELQKQSEHQFHPDVVRAFLGLSECE
jgi:HD-GYP domain-containing protein (c-di-GMP phosphodiesterase class II)